ncbi:MAG: hypothetical protein ACXIT4_01230 [Erythrobacter sp.]
MQNASALVRTAALTLRPQRIDPLDTARSLIVLGCAAALIMAGPVLPL